MLHGFDFRCQAVAGAHVVATDTWVSMGQEEEAAKRIKDYEGYQVGARLLPYLVCHEALFLVIPKLA